MHFELGAPDFEDFGRWRRAQGFEGFDPFLGLARRTWAARAFSAAFLTVDRRIVLMHCMEKVLRDVRTLVGDFGTLLGPKLAVKSAYGTGPRWDRFGRF